MENNNDYTKKAKDFATNVSGKISKTADVVKESAKTIVITTFDQTGSGTLGQEDLKILTEKGKVLAGKAADEAIVIAKEVKKSNLFKEAVAGAIVGAVIAIPIPFLGPLMGAAIGGVIGIYINVARSGKI
jgi:uncharacterized membrane protein